MRGRFGALQLVALDASAMGHALAKCAGKCLEETVPCPTCDGTGICKYCDGKGIIYAKMESEVFSYVLDKKGAYRDFMEPPKQCDKCGGWGSVPIFRGINTSVSPAGCMQEGPRGKYSECAKGSGKCSTCKGTGYVKRPPDWLKEQIIATSPPRFQIAGPLMTTKQQIGPLIVPQDAERWEAKNMIKNWGSLS